MTTVSISGGEKLEAKLKEIADALGSSRHVSAGFLSGATYPDGTSVALVAAVQEYGSPSKGIPPRPFLRSTVADHSAEWPDFLANALLDNDYDLTKALEVLGEGIKGQIQRSISEFTSPPLAESTIKKKGTDKPLIESATMFNAVDFEVVDGIEES